MHLASAPEQPEKFVLNIVFKDVNSPWASNFLSNTAYATIHYRLTDVKSDDVLYDKEIKTDYTATLSPSKATELIFIGALIGGILEPPVPGVGSYQFEEVPFSLEGPGPFNGEQRVIFAMTQAIALNIRRALFEINKL